MDGPPAMKVMVVVLLLLGEAIVVREVLALTVIVGSINDLKSL